jgi:hypothetical protein
MHSIGLGAVLGLLLSALVLITPQPAAYAEHCGPGQASQEIEGGFSHICVSVTIPPTPGGGGTGDNTGGGGPATCQDEDGDVVPCTFQVEITSDGSSAFYPHETERPVPGDAENTTPIPAFVRRLSLSLVVGEEKIREPKSEDSDEPKHDGEPTSY